MSIFHKLSPAHIWDEVKGKIHSAIGKAEHTVEGFAKTAEQTVETKALAAVHGVQDAEHAAKGAVAEAVNKELERVPEFIRGEVKALLAHLAGGLASAALHKGAELLEKLLPQSYTLTLGPLTLSWDDVDADVENLVADLRRWAKQPPTGKEAITELVVDLGPDAITLEVSAALAALFVESDDLSAGTSFTWSKGSYEKRLEEVLTAFGL